MTKKLNWRLSKLPSVDELRELVKDKIITQEEAREILFNLEDEVDRDKRSLESEIKFLRELVEKLANGRNEIITTVREIEVPYRRYPWYAPYITWCDTNTITTHTISSILNTSENNDNDVVAAFTTISTF